MTDPINESFSALLDNEASDMDIQRLLNAMDSQPEKVTHWKKVASGHSKCQGEQSFDVLNQINESLYDQGEIDQISAHQIIGENSEESAIQVNDSWFSKSKKWLSSAGIAASVCVISVFTINSTTTILATNDTPNEAPTVLATGNPTATPIGQESLLIQQQLKEHYQQRASQTSGQPFVIDSDNQTQNAE